MKENSCTPINPKKYSCYGLKKNSYKEFGKEKKFLRLENSPPPPPPNNFSNGPSLKTVPSEDCNFSPLSVFHNSVFHISSSTKSTGVCFHLPLSIYCKIKGGNTASFRCSAFGFCKQLLLASFSQNLCICLLV